jgi:ribose transport system substrate-binding protein
MMAAGARLAAKGAGKQDGDIKILGTDGLPGPAGGIRAVAEGQWAATFPTRPAARRQSRWQRPSCSTAPRAFRPR